MQQQQQDQPQYVQQPPQQQQQLPTQQQQQQPQPQFMQNGNQQPMYIPQQQMYIPMQQQPQPGQQQDISNQFVMGDPNNAGKPQMVPQQMNSGMQTPQGYPIMYQQQPVQMRTDDSSVASTLGNDVDLRASTQYSYQGAPQQQQQAPLQGMMQVPPQPQYQQIPMQQQPPQQIYYQQQPYGQAAPGQMYPPMMMQYAPVPQPQQQQQYMPQQMQQIPQPHQQQQVPQQYQAPQTPQTQQQQQQQPQIPQQMTPVMTPQQPQMNLPPQYQQQNLQQHQMPMQQQMYHPQMQQQAQPPQMLPQQQQPADVHHLQHSSHQQSLQGPPQQQQQMPVMMTQQPQQQLQPQLIDVNHGSLPIPQVIPIQLQQQQQSAPSPQQQAPTNLPMEFTAMVQQHQQQQQPSQPVPAIPVAQQQYQPEQLQQAVVVTSHNHQDQLQQQPVTLPKSPEVVPASPSKNLDMNMQQQSVPLNLPESLISQSNSVHHEERKGFESSSMMAGPGHYAINGGEDDTTNNDRSKVIDTAKRGHLAFVNANIYQAAILNKLLPPGFKIEFEDVVKRNYEQKLAAQKKAQLAPKKKKVAPITQITASTPAPISAMNAKKLPTTLSGAPIVGADRVDDVQMTEVKQPIQKVVPVAQTTQQVKVQPPISALPTPTTPLTKAVSTTSLSGGAGGQRTSARDKKLIDYGQMAAGTGDISASMDYGEVSGQNARTLQKKTSVSGGSNNLVPQGAINQQPLPDKAIVTTTAQAIHAQQMQAHQEAVEEVKQTVQKCNYLISSLEMHPSVLLFTMPPDPSNPRLFELMQDPNQEMFNLVTVKNKFFSSQYQTTFKLIGDIRRMLQTYKSLYRDDTDKLDKIQEMQKYFDNFLQSLGNIDNLPLIAPPVPVLDTTPSPAPQRTQTQVGQNGVNVPAPAINKQRTDTKKFEKVQSELNKIKEPKAQATGGKTASTVSQATSQVPQQHQAPIPQNQAAFDAMNAAKNQRSQNQVENLINLARTTTTTDKPMNMEEKNSLKQNIGALNEEQQRGIILLVQDVLSQNGGEVFEFELDQLPPRKCRELENYVKKCLSANIKKEKRKLADQSRRQAQKQQQQLKMTGQPPSSTPTAQPVQQQVIQPQQPAQKYQQIDVMPQQPQMQGIQMQMPQQLSGAPQQQQYMMNQLQQQQQQPQGPTQQQQTPYGQPILQPGTQPGQPIIQGVGIPGQVIGQPIYGNPMMLGQMPQQQMVPQQQMPQNQAQLMMMMQQQNQQHQMQPQLQPQQQQQTPGQGGMPQQMPQLQQPQIQNQPSQHGSMTQPQQQQGVPMQHGQMQPGNVGQPVQQPQQYPRLQGMDSGRFMMPGQQKKQAAAASDSDSDSDSSSSESDSENESKKKKLQIKSSHHRAPGAPPMGGPGGNPGSSNLNAIWKKTM